MHKNCRTKKCRDVVTYGGKEAGGSHEQNSRRRKEDNTLRGALSQQMQCGLMTLHPKLKKEFVT